MIYVDTIRFITRKELALFLSWEYLRYYVTKRETLSGFDVRKKEEFFVAINDIDSVASALRRLPQRARAREASCRGKITFITQDEFLSDYKEVKWVKTKQGPVAVYDVVTLLRAIKQW